MQTNLPAALVRHQATRLQAWFLPSFDGLLSGLLLQLMTLLLLPACWPVDVDMFA